MIYRNITEKLLALSRQFPVVTLTGPRQSGKTTLVKKVFAHLPYVSLESPETRLLIQNDPKGFLNNYKNGVILDEVQRLPDLFSYIQIIVDEDNKEGQFILTGSQNFLLLEKITQSLAGRVAILKLLPFCLGELKTSGLLYEEYEDFIFNGFYPRLYDKKIPAIDYYPNYIQTYVERDVKQIKNITDQNSFIRFLQMCAGRIGQLLNVSSLANDCGISQITAKSWLSILEASYVIYFLYPFHKNFNKRLVKMPKIYFFDTGLACSLLNIREKEQIQSFYLKGGLFENFIINEIVKNGWNKGDVRNNYFWRDKLGHEIDCIIEEGNRYLPVEIKAGKTISKDYTKEIAYWNKLSGNNPENSYVIYGGDKNYKLKKGNYISWKNLETFLSNIK